MRYFLVMAAALVFADATLAQAPAGDDMTRAQRKAGAAYSELQKAEYETKRAEQEYRQADDSYRAAQKRAEELKLPSEAAQKKFSGAKAAEAAVRKTYDDAVKGAVLPFGGRITGPKVTRATRP